MHFIKEMIFLALIVGVHDAEILNAHQSHNPPAGAPSAEAPSAEAISQRLEEVSGGKLDIDAARLVVRSAGRSGDKTLSAKLKSIALKFSKMEDDGGRDTVAFEALKGLWRLGEPKEYFLRNAKNYKENAVLACYSIWILAYSPEPEISKELPSQKETLSNDLINEALQDYRMVESLSKRYQATVEFDKRFSLLVLCADSGWILDGDSLHVEYSARVVWGQSRLYELSKEDPAAVAKSIFSFRQPWLKNGADIEKLKTYFLRHVVDEARSQFKLLNEAEAAKSQ